MVGTTLIQVQPWPIAGLPEVRGAEAPGQHQAAAMDQRRGGGDHLGVDVVQRQHGHHAVGRAEFMHRRNELPAGNHGALRQHHALGLAGGARGVHHQRGIFLARAVRHRGARLRRRQEFGGIDVAHDHARRLRQPCRGLLQAFDLVGRDEHDPGVAVLQHVGELRRLGQQVERRDAVAAVHRADEQAAGLVAVGHQQRHFRAGANALAGQPGGQAQRSRPQFAEAHHPPGFRRDQVGRIGANRRLMFDQCPDRAQHAYLPYLRKCSPKISSSAGSRGAIRREMRVMFR
jgi:hypothetical protein